MDYLEDDVHPVAQVEETDVVQEGEETVTPRRKEEDWRKRLFYDAKDVFYMLALFMLVYILCFRTVVVIGNSMYDTLVDGDRILLISSMLYLEPKQGDVVVFSKDSFRSGECIIKRVIASEGQHVRINFETGTVYVDEVALEEPYLYTPTTDPESEKSEWIVPEGCLFVMGDNRGDSLDSRSNSIGFVDKREIIGKAVIIMLPGLDKENNTRDFKRIGVIGNAG